MIIIGHKLIPYEKQYQISSSQQIENTPPNSTLFLKEFDMELMHYLCVNELSYSVVVQNTQELIVANALGAEYIITTDPKKDQEIATNYLFDAKLLTFIKQLSEIESLVSTNIDGVIFQDAVVTSY